jgi:nitrite reductase (NADH) small subunit
MSKAMAWQRVCASKDLGEGQSIEIIFRGDVLAIYRHENSLYAIDGICMHQGGPLARGKVAGGTVTCPWHGWQYELATGNHAPTCKPMLKTFQIQESNGVIEIDLPA